MQRVYAARSEAAADRKVKKRRRRTKTPVLDSAEEKHGKDVRKEQAEKEKTQAEVQADVEAAEAAVDGDFSASVVNQEELDAIKAAAVADGTFMKAPNGKPTNLTERQWLQVRTKAFMDWFGDWERVSSFRAAYNSIMSMASVASLSGKEFGRGLTPEKMAEHWQTVCGGVVEHDVLGEVALTKRSAKDCLAHGLNREKIAVFSKVHEVIRNGVIFDRQSNWKQRGYDTCCLAAPVTINGKEYVCQVVVKQFKDRNQFYLHEVELKEKLPAEGRTGFYFGSTSGGAKGLLAQKAEEVNAIWENCSKVVDENGEPMVVYHGTNRGDFTVFSTSNQWGYGAAYFANRREVADIFAAPSMGHSDSRVYEVFVNLRNPLVIEADNARYFAIPRPEVMGQGDSTVDTQQVAAFARDNGYDGVIVRDVNESEVITDDVLVFEPSQIKSATDNRGTFDGSSDDMTLSVTDAQDSGLFEDGVMEAANAVVVAPDASFSVKALHASPHKFRKFSTEKMGSGEGHQAFGWGLYFAESEDVNREYHRQFSQQTSEFMLDGKKVRELELIEFLNDQVGYEVADYVLLAVKDAWDTGTRIKKGQAEKKQYEEWLKTPLESPYADWQLKRLISGQKAQLKALRFVKKHKIKRVGASNYRVELNVDESNLLMWDKAVPAELHEAVRTLEDGKQTGGMVAMPEAGKETWPGYRIYNELARKLGQNVQDLLSPKFGQGPKLASEWLLAHGYKGIKYLDGMSRAAGEGSYNYVIFSGDDVKITGVNETGDYHAPWEEYKDVDASFSVIGPSAQTWDKYEDSRKFKGRDDGKDRVEIDASQAKLTPRAFLGDAGDEYRLMVAGKAMPFNVQDDLEKLREQQKLIDGWYHILFETDDVDKAQEYSHEHGMTQEWWSVNTALLKNVKEFVARQLQLAGVTGEGKYGNLLQSNGKLMGLVMESLISGKVNEDVAAELDKMSGGNMKCLKDVLDYEELYEAYPDLKWLPVGVADLGYELRGRLFVKGGYPDSIELNVRLDAAGRRSTLLHEIQHAIQNIEEFAKGGTAEKAGKVLEKQVRQYRIRLEHLRHEQRWLYAVDTAKDHLQRMLRLLKRPRAILKMGERFAVHEMQHVPTMAAQAIEMMWKEYTEIAMRDYGDSVAYAPGEGYKLPGRGSESVTQAAVEQLLEKVKTLPSRRAGTLRGRRQKVEAEIERLYEENKHKLNMTDMSGSELYQRLAGEIESRNVQERRDWTMAERMARPFNETLEYPGEALVSFSVSPTLMADIRSAAYNKMDSKAHVRLCSMPTVLRMLGEPEGDVYTLPGTISKLVYTHNLAHPEVYRAVEELDDPLFVFRDTETSYLFVLEMQATNNKGVKSNVAVAIQLQRSESGHYLLSAYPLDALAKIKDLQKQGRLVYSKYTAQELEDAINKQAIPPADNAPSPFKLDLMRSAVKDGLPPTVPTKEDLVKYKDENSDFSASMVNLDEQALASEVVAAGQGFRAKKNPRIGKDARGRCSLPGQQKNQLLTRPR